MPSSFSDMEDYHAGFAALQEHSAAGIAVYDAVDDGRDFLFHDLNSAGAALSRIKRADVLGRSVLECFPGVRRLGLFQLLQKVWKDGRTRHLPLSFYHDDRITQWVENTVVRLPSGRVMAIYNDITKQKQSEADLMDSEARYRNLYTKTPAMLHSIDNQGRIINVSDHWLEKMGYDRKEVIGQPSTVFLTEESRSFAKEHVLPDFFVTGKVTDVPYTFVTKDGRHLEVLLSATSEKDVLGEVVRSLAVMVDVTERNRDQEKLARSEERLTQVIRGGRLGFWDWDVASGTVIYNDRWAAILGYGLDEIDQSYTFWKKAIHPDDWEEAYQALIDHLEDRSPIFESEHRLKTRSGEWAWVLGVGRVSSRGEDGSPLRVTGIMRDITQRKRNEVQLAESQRRFRDVALVSGDWIWELDAKGRYTYASESVTAIMGYTPEELLGTTPFELMPPEEADRLAPIFRDIVTRRDPIRDIENWNLTKDGRTICLLTNGIPLVDDKGDLTGYFGVDKDITRRKQSEQKLLLFESVFNSALEGITITNARGDLVAVNPGFSAITGYEPSEVLGKNPRILKSQHHDEAFYQEMWESLAANGSWEGEIWNRRKSGDVYPEWLSISAILNPVGEITHYVAVFHDITETKAKEETIRFQAYHDALTNLPNRALLQDRLSVAIARCKRTGSKLGVIFIDLDNFKTINDSLGHNVGDKLLQAVARRFLDISRDGDTVSRLGGDEFVLLIDSMQDPQNTIDLAERILAAMRDPFLVGEYELFITPSLGISIFPDDSEDPDELIKYADMAMYKAKEQGRNNYHLYTSEMNTRVMRRLELDGSMRKSLANRDFFLMYQPKICLNTLSVTGMEALVRWRRNGEIVPPDEFIPLAEETGVIVPLGELVLDIACSFSAGLRAGNSGLPISVNLSPRQFEQPELIAVIENILNKTGLAPSMLEMELTETTLVQNIRSSQHKLAILRDLGVSIAVDDFGTGYSSLSYLKLFPLNTLKIDRSFIIGLGQDRDDEQLTKTIVQLGKNFGLTVVAEGVETVEQLDMLKEFGCDQVQGFLFSPPLLEADFSAFLDKPLRASPHTPGSGR